MIVEWITVHRAITVACRVGPALTPVAQHAIPLITGTMTHLARAHATLATMTMGVGPASNVTSVAPHALGATITIASHVPAWSLPSGTSPHPIHVHA